MFESLLIIHGKLITYLFLFTAVFIGFILLRSIIRRVRQRDAMLRVERLGEPRDEVDDAHRGEVVTLVGTLDAVGRCPSFEDGKEVAASTIVSRRDPADACSIRAAQITLKVGGSTVMLEGPLDVVAGSEERWPLWAVGRLPGSVKERVFKAGELSSRDPVALRSVSSGERVRVRGVLATGVDEEELGYRVGSVVWRLLPAPSVSEAKVLQGIPWLEVAAEPPHRIKGTGVPRLGMKLFTMASLAFFAPSFIYFLIFVLGGSLAMSYTPRFGKGLWPAVFASATHSRGPALNEMRSVLPRMADIDPEALRQLVALSRVDPLFDEHHFVLSQMQAGRMDVAESFARQQGSRRLIDVVARRLFAMGRFERASEMDSSNSRGRLWSSPHRAMSRLLAGNPSSTRTPEVLGGMRCISQHDDHRGPLEIDPDVVRREGPRCALMLAELLGGSERLGEIQRCRACSVSEELAATAALLRYETLLGMGSCPSEACEVAANSATLNLAHLTPQGVAELLRPTHVVAPPGLERSLLDHLAGRDDLSEASRRLRAELAASMAAFELLVDDRSAARELVAAALEDLRSLPADVEQQINCALAIAVSIEIRDGQQGNADLLIDGLWSSNGGRELAQKLYNWSMYAQSSQRFDASSLVVVSPSKGRRVLEPSGPMPEVSGDDEQPFLAFAHHPSELVSRFLLSGSSEAQQNVMPYGTLLQLSRDLAAAAAMGEEERVVEKRQGLTAFREALLRRSTSVFVHGLYLEISELSPSVPIPDRRRAAEPR